MSEQRHRIGLREVRAISPGETLYDATVGGFAARRQQGPNVTYLIRYRTRDGRQRWHTIGRHGSQWTPDQARQEALRVLGGGRGRRRPGRRAEGRTIGRDVGNLCDLYWTAATSGGLLTRWRVPKKASTLASDRSRIDGHIKPLLGMMKVRSVNRRDVEAFMRAVAAGDTAKPHAAGERKRGAELTGGLGVASRTVGLLGAIFTFAVAEGIRPDNPVHGVMRPADGRRDRRLTDAEFGQLGAALERATAAGAWPATPAVVRFLALTGWRSGEALGLQWADLDLTRRTAILPDTKTGRSMRPLSAAAVAVLASMKLRTAGHVFQGQAGGELSALPRSLARIVAGAGLPPDITAHVLRHTFASVAADLGYSEPTIATLIGHKGHSITSRYIHSADAVLLAASDAVADHIVGLMTK